MYVIKHTIQNLNYKVDIKTLIVASKHKLKLNAKQLDKEGWLLKLEINPLELPSKSKDGKSHPLNLFLNSNTKCSPLPIES